GSAWSVVPTPSPSSSQNYLGAVADLARGDAWAVGVGGSGGQPLIEHWNGSQWGVVAAASDATGVGDYLADVAGDSGTDVWAVGYHFDSTIGGWDGLIEHWNGASWSIVPSPSTLSQPSPANVLSLSSVVALSPSDAWASGSLGIAGQSGSQTALEH